MDPAADAVAAEFANYAKSAGANFLLDGAPDLIDAVIGPGDLQGFLKRALGASRKPPRSLRDGLDRNGDRGIGHVAVFFEGHIELHEITPLNFAGFGGDAVNGFIIQADQHVSREIVNECGSRTSAVLPHDFAADVGEFERADAGANAAGHG